MDDKQALLEHLFTLPKDGPQRKFLWSATLNVPQKRVDGSLERYEFNTVTASSWQQAGILVALECLNRPEHLRFTDALLRCKDNVVRAFARTPLEAINHPDLVRHDQPADPTSP